ncbi:hypothetical protein DB313_05655 (plasmid) [Borrelia turcica IST7]|uniref:Uncharacterized protein n=1 Tax=Borrelia turcica IST7 TaxID=1104446 RepID=A0A386PNB8_9SPIR|nr:hypothetical protein [Borrelia turcica]AYE36984.1 hypothetical protein DB313_05655 [Borrelia turcica IST7]
MVNSTNNNRDNINLRGKLFNYVNDFYEFAENIDKGTYERMEVHITYAIGVFEELFEKHVKISENLDEAICIDFFDNYVATSLGKNTLYWMSEIFSEYALALIDICSSKSLSLEDRHKQMREVFVKFNDVVEEALEEEYLEDMGQYGLDDMIENSRNYYEY